MIVMRDSRLVRSKDSAEWPGFLTLLPAIRQQAAVAFRHRSAEAREEAVEEVVANAFVAYSRLVQLGKTELAYATPLAQFAIRQYHAGRRVGSRLNRRDVMSPRARRDQTVTLERLDQFDPSAHEWREALVEDQHVGPAETAAARLDIAAWMRSLGSRNRRLARALARGETTAQVARLFGIAPSRVSQLRGEFRKSWRQFQGEPIRT